MSTSEMENEFGYPDVAPVLCPQDCRELLGFSLKSVHLSEDGKNWTLQFVDGYGKMQDISFEGDPDVCKTAFYWRDIWAD